MVKTIILLVIFFTASNSSQSFEEACIKCHIEGNIPNEVIYKRYLSKYSSHKKMSEAMVDYLKNPTKQKTIMPPRFIDIFGLKEAMTLSDDELNKHVNELIKTYDIKKRLTLPRK